MPVAELVDLSPKERALIRGVSLALDNYEPFPAFFAPRSGALESLLAKGLVERGPSKRAVVASEGYRLTDRGWSVLKRI